MEITVKTDTAEQFVDLLARLAQGASAPALTEIADAVQRGNAELMAQLNQMRQVINDLKEPIMLSLNKILESVEAQSGTVDSVVAFISGLEKRLDEIAAGADEETQAKLQKLTDQLTKNQDKLAAAIDNNPNTPAKPTDPAEGGGETPTPTEPAPTDPAVTPPGGPTTPPTDPTTPTDAPTPTEGQPAGGSVTGG